MHVAVLIGLIGFAVSTKKIGSAVAEMNWLKNEPYGIVHASMLKPLSMLLTSGLLFIFVILCINSFISARKEKAAQAKLDEEKKKNVLRKVKNNNASATEAKTPSDMKDSAEGDKKDEEDKKDSTEDDKRDSDDKGSDEVIDEKENSSASKDNNEMDSEKNKDVSDSDPIEGDQEKDRSSPSNDSPSENDEKKEDNKKEKVSLDPDDSSEEDSETKKDTKEESQDHKDWSSVVRQN